MKHRGESPRRRCRGVPRGDFVKAGARAIRRRVAVESVRGRICQRSPEGCHTAGDQSQPRIILGLTALLCKRRSTACGVARGLYRLVSRYTSAGVRCMRVAPLTRSPRRCLSASAACPCSFAAASARRCSMQLRIHRWKRSLAARLRQRGIKRKWKAASRRNRETSGKMGNVDDRQVSLGQS